MSQPSLRAFSALAALCAVQLVSGQAALAKGGGGGHGGGGHSSSHSSSSHSSSSHVSAGHASTEHSESRAETSRTSSPEKSTGTSEKPSGWSSWFKRTPPSTPRAPAGGSGGNGGGNPGRPTPVRNNGYRGNGWGFGGWGHWPWRSSRSYYHPYYFAHTMGGHRQGDPCEPGGVNADQKSRALSQANPFQNGASAVGAVTPVDLGYAARQDCVANPNASDDFEDNESHSGRNAALAGGAGLLGAGAIGAVVFRRRRKMGM